MHINELFQLSVRGDVHWRLHQGDITQAEVKRHNVITYAAADIMARLLGGDATYIPNCIGFFYGTAATAPLLPDPDTLPDATKRIHTWAGITTDVTNASGNIMIAPMVLNPAWSVDGSTSTYSGNAVTMAAYTGSFLEYAFPTASPFAGALVTGNYFYQALLLNRRVLGSSIVYTPFARVSLADTGVYHAKPAGFELSLFWSIIYS